MPPLSTAPRKKKGKKKGKAKAVKLIPDPDAAYRRQLDEMLYIPKETRARILARHESKVDYAIESFTARSAVDGVPTRDVSAIPLITVPKIIRSLDFCVTDDQLNQISAMVTQDGASAAPKEPNGSKEKGYMVRGYADRAKLKSLLVELCHTHVLAYDPQVLSQPPLNYPQRVSTVVYTASEERLQRCFQALWENTGCRSTSSAEGITMRSISSSLLSNLLGTAESISSICACLTAEEIEDLIALISNGDQVILETDFIGSLSDVPKRREVL